MTFDQAGRAAVVSADDRPGGALMSLLSLAGGAAGDGGVPSWRRRPSATGAGDQRRRRLSRLFVVEGRHHQDIRPLDVADAFLDISGDRHRR
jgi:hypothetical protein